MKNPTVKGRMIIKSLRPDTYKKFSVRKLHFANVCAVFYNETKNLVSEMKSLKSDLISEGYDVRSNDELTFAIIL